MMASSRCGTEWAVQSTTQWWRADWDGRKSWAVPACVATRPARTDFASKAALLRLGSDGTATGERQELSNRMMSACAAPASAHRMSCKRPDLVVCGRHSTSCLSG
ncbi:hypothetical protein PRIC2_003414 [Phytophthora ramorum]